MKLSEATKIRSQEAGWASAFIERLEESPLNDNQVRNLLALRITEERADKYLTLIEQNPDRPALRMQMNWARPTTELGMRAKPGPNGLGMPEINIGTYGHVPDHWPYENDTPLGSHPTPGSYMPGPYSVYLKSEVWAEGLDEMYEEAIRDHWAPATAIKWADLQPQAEDIERAICQVCTLFSQHGIAESKVQASWEEKIAYGFHDMKNLMGTQIFDTGRKVEVLRKRALANGGGLGQQGLGTLYRAWFGSLKATEMLVCINVVYKSYEVAAFEMLAEACPLEVDRDIFSRLAHDSRRHLEFGKRHLKYYLQHHPNAREFMVHFLNKGEAALADELTHSKTEGDALAIIFGGGVENIEAGRAKVRSLREQQLRKYIGILDECGLDRLPAVNRGLFMLAGAPA